MAEFKKSSLEENRFVAVAAIASVEPKPNMTEADWHRAIVRRAASIQRARMFSEEGVLLRVLDSVKIRATVKSVSYEESSCRYVITYVASNSNDGQSESIRTLRMDSIDGKLLEPAIEKLKSIAGTDSQVIIFKHNDIPTAEQKEQARKEGRTIPAAGYRQAVWFEFVD